MKLIQSIVGIMFMVFVVAVTVFEGNKIILSLSPPVSYLSIAADTPARAGENLRISLLIKRARFCKASLDMFMVNTKTSEVIWRNSVAGGATELGTHKVKQEYTVPKDADPGDYRFVTRGFYDCYEGMHVITFPAVEFKVVK